MKLQFSIMVIALFAVTTFAQAQIKGSEYAGKLSFFTEEGENFTLFLNGEQMNAKPTSKVDAEDINDVSVSIRIVFEDAAVPPLKKTIMRMGRDCVYMIKKNKKGEYTTSVKSCTGTLGPQQAPMAATPVAPLAPSAPAGGKLTATYTDGVIHLSDGSMFTVTKSKTAGGWPSPHVVMNAPTGAKVTISYDDNKETYNTEVPFDYEVKDYNNNNSYFRLTVDQGGPDRTWYVRLQNGTGYKLTIE